MQSFSIDKLSDEYILVHSPSSDIIEVLHNFPAIRSQLERLELPNTQDYVRNNPLVKDGVIPIGPSGKADMRFSFQSFEVGFAVLHSFESCVEIPLICLLGKAPRPDARFKELLEAIRTPNDPLQKVVALIGVSGT